MSKCDCECHRAFTECDNCCKEKPKPKFFQFEPVFRIRVIAMDEESALKQAKAQFQRKFNIPMEFIDDAFEHGADINKMRLK